MRKFSRACSDKNLLLSADKGLAEGTSKEYKGLKAFGYVYLSS